MAEYATADVIYAAPLAEGQTRVLALQPGEGDDLLECQIQVVDAASEEIPYDAISYVWGSQNVTDVIRCESDGDGVCMPLTKNAADALRAVRRADGVRRVWIDSICISQTSSVEKTAQVAMMDNIFANAATVLIWLGTDDAGQSAAAAEVAILIHEQFGHEMHSARRGDIIEQEGTPARQRCYDKVGLLLPLFECEWFWRSWCVQELALANEPLMYWGSTVFTWDVILTAAAFIQSKAQLHVAHMGVAGVYNVVMLEALRARINSVQKLKYLETDIGLPENMPFSRLLSLTRLHGVTEPCDRVFSLLGLDRRLRMPGPGSKQSLMVYPWIHNDHAPHSDRRMKQPLIKPDYSQSLDSVYLSTARALLRREPNLHLLSFVQHDGEVGQGDLPSWVPRWHINKHRLISQLDLHPTTIYTSLARALESSTFDGSPGPRISAHWSVRDQQSAVESDGALLADGLLLTTVTEVCSDATFTVERSDQQLATLRQWLLCVSSWFKNHDQTDRLDAPASELEDVVFNMFYRTILGGHFRANELFMGLRQELPEFRALLSSDATDTTTSRCPITQAFVTQICRSRTSFLTDSSRLGIGPQCLRTGDSVCYLAGAAIPLLLRGRSNSDVTHRHWLLIGETYVDGLTPSTSRLGADGDYETLMSHQAIYANESLRCNEDDKDARNLLHLPHFQRRNFLYALEDRIGDWSGRGISTDLMSGLVWTIGVSAYTGSPGPEFLASFRHSRVTILLNVFGFASTDWRSHSDICLWTLIMDASLEEH